ncbi:permease-like cell division protein FtsX [Patescibacteria group bacterium]|nr:permease-like cell division protein FtsX [Patescibacteria group bacterium]MBU1895937.1 permease-like cell division protein FtsX [Patescibacteria group bacterium]
MFNSFFRVIKFAFQDIIRNISLSLMTILILVLMLLSINTLIIIGVLTDQATSVVKEQIDVSIYFDHEATNEQIEEVNNYITQFPEVTSVEFFDTEAVIAQFREQHADNPEILASLDELGENPLGATLVVRTREPLDYQKIIDALRVPEYENIIEAKTFGDTEKAIERIDIITKQVERFTLALSVLFAIIAFLIIFNTIRVAIYTQRTEISIKKLVGATNWFVQGPYLLEAFIFTVVSMIISYGLIFGVFGFLDPYVAVVFQEPEILTNYFNSNIIMLLSTQFGAVLLLTIISSLLAMRKHLRV